MGRTHDAEVLGARRVQRIAVEHCDDEQSDLREGGCYRSCARQVQHVSHPIVRDGQQQEERDGWVALAEHGDCDEPRERDVRRRWNAPPAAEDGTSHWGCNHPLTLKSNRVHCLVHESNQINLLGRDGKTKPDIRAHPFMYTERSYGAGAPMPPVQ